MTSKVVQDAQEVASPFVRHLGIFDPRKHDVSATVIGCGAIGSFVAMGLAKMGVKQQILYDFDKVEALNLPIQMHHKSKIGLNKAEATAEMLMESCPEEMDITVLSHKWEDHALKSDIVVSAVDNLEVRKKIWGTVKYDSKVKILVDARIGGQMIRTYAINPMESKDIELYDKSFPKSDMKGSELPCTKRGVIDVSLFASALLIRSIRRWIANHEKETYLTYNLAGEFKSIIS